MVLFPLSRVLREFIVCGVPYSNPSPQELANILEDESDSERDTLVELIFFPDESIPVRLEDLLEHLDLNDKEVVDFVLIDYCQLLQFNDIK
jgi:hypothetical protein